MRGRRSKKLKESWVYAHFWPMKPIPHQSPLRGAHIFWNEGSLQIFTPYYLLTKLLMESSKALISWENRRPMWHLPTSRRVFRLISFLSTRIIIIKAVMLNSMLRTVNGKVSLSDNRIWRHSWLSNYLSDNRPSTAQVPYGGHADRPTHSYAV